MEAIEEISRSFNQQVERVRQERKDLEEFGNSQREELQKERKRLQQEWDWVKKATGLSSRDCDCDCDGEDFQQQQQQQPHMPAGTLPTTGVPPSSQSPSFLSLNVGGRLFSTTRATLVDACPDSMLAAMFSGRHPVARDPQGNAFIDRNGDAFAEVLEWLRTGKLFHNKGDPARSRLLVEAQYFMIPSLEEELCPALFTLSAGSTILTTSAMRDAIVQMLPPAMATTRFSRLLGGAGSSEALTAQAFDSAVWARCRSFGSNLLVVIREQAKGFVFGAFLPLGQCDAGKPSPLRAGAFIFTLECPDSAGGSLRPVKLTTATAPFNLLMGGGLRIATDLIAFGDPGGNSCIPQHFNVVDPSFMPAAVTSSLLAGSPSWTLAMAEVFIA